MCHFILPVKPVDLPLSLFIVDAGSTDHPQLHAQVPAKGPHHQEEGPHRLTAQPQVRGVPHLCLRRDRLHCRHCLSEPAGEWVMADTDQQALKASCLFFIFCGLTAKHCCSRKF